MYAIRLAIPDGIDLAGALLPRIAAVVRGLAQSAYDEWQDIAMGQAPLPNGQRLRVRSGGYARSLGMVQTGPYAWEVFNSSPYADAIENGTGTRDLKRMLDASFKVRTTRDGRRYLVIPFRWGTGTGSGGGVSFGNVMPPAIHDRAVALEATRVTGNGRRLSGTGAFSVVSRTQITVRQRSYGSASDPNRWGGRLPAGLAPKLKPEHATDPYAGMVKFQHPTRGGSRDTHYLTFRTMIEGGRGWVVPAQPGQYPARAVAERLNRLAPRLLQRALAQDLAAVVQGG